MTKRTKILSTLCLFALVLCCAFGVFSYAGANNARAEVVAPSVDEAKVEAITGIDVATIYGSKYVANATPTTSEWIIFDWTNEGNWIAAASNNFFFGVNTSISSTQKTCGSWNSVNMVADSVQGNKYEGTHVRFYVNLNTGVFFYVKDGVTTVLSDEFGVLPHRGATVATAPGGNITLAEGASLYASFYVHGQTTNLSVGLKNLKVFDENGNDLGVKTTFTNQTVPSQYDDVEANDSYTGINKTGAGSLFNTAPSTDGIVIFDYTLGAGSVASSNNDALFGFISAEKYNYTHTANIWTGKQVAGNVQQHTTSSGMPHIFTNNTENDVRVRVLFDANNGAIYYKRGSATKWTILKDFSAYASHLGSANTSKGWHVFLDPHTGPSVIYKNAVVYDGSGNLLGTAYRSAQGGISHNIPDSSEYTSANFTTTSTASNGTSLHFRSGTPTTAEWVYMSWTNGDNNQTVSGASGKFYAYINKNNAKYTSGGATAGCVGIFTNTTYHTRSFGASGKTVVLAFNTKTGLTFMSTDGGSTFSLVSGGNLNGNQGALLGSANSEAGYYVGWSANTGMVDVVTNDIKCFDSDGNDLGININDKLVRNTKMTFVKADTQASRFLIRFNLTDVRTGENFHEGYTLGGDTNKVYVNGELSTLNGGAYMYEVEGYHTWLFTPKLLSSTTSDVNGIPQSDLSIKKGMRIVGDSSRIVLTEDLNLYFSGGYVGVAQEREEISLVNSRFDVDPGNYRFNGLSTWKTADGDPAFIYTYNFYAYKNNDRTAKVNFYSKAESNINMVYFSFLGLEANDSDYTKIEPHYYFIPKGTVIGANYYTDTDYIFHVDNKGSANFFRADKVFTVNFDGLEGAEAPEEITFSYAEDFNITLPSIEAPRGYEFLGWKYGDTEITNITPGMFGSDITVTAILEEVSMFPNVDASNIEGVTHKISSGQASIKNSVAYANNAKWVIFEWENHNNGLRLGNGSNSFHLYVNSVGGAMPQNYGNYVSTSTITKIYVNLLTGEAYYQRDDEEPVLMTTFDMPTLGEGEHYTVKILFNGFESKGTAVGQEPAHYKVTGLKMYDDKGTNLAVATTGFWVETPVNFELVSASPRPGDGDYLIYWNVRDLNSSEIIYPALTLGKTINPLVINGETVITENTSSGYKSGEKHMWQLTIKTLNPNYTHINQVAPVELYFAEGTRFINGNKVYILDNTFYVYLSGAAIQVSDTQLRTEVSIDTANTAFSYSTASKRFQGNLYAMVGGESTKIPMYSVLVNKNGTSKEKVLWWEHGGGVSYMSITNLDANYTAHTDIDAQWYLLPAGSVIGNIYTLDTDYVMQINKGSLKIFRRDKVFTVNFDGLEGAEAPEETTFSYAEDFNITLPSIEAPRGYKFLGWKYGDTEITNITPGMFGSDITVTAILQIDLPVVDASDITDTVDVLFNQTCGGSNHFMYNNGVSNAIGAGKDAKWIIFEWTNGKNNAVGDGNGSYIGVTKDSDSSAQDFHSAKDLFTASKAIKLYVSLETGLSYIERDGGVYPFKTFTIPELNEGESVYVVFKTHSSKDATLLGLKCYDDSGNDLGIRLGGRTVTLEEAPTINEEFAGNDATTNGTSSCVNFVSQLSTKSEWIIFEWTNGANNTREATVDAEGGTLHAMRMGISESGGADAYHATSNGYQLDTILKTANATVKIYFNTVEGYMGYNVTGVTGENEIYVVKRGLNTTDGSVALYAGFCFHVANTAELFGLKCYDGEGNNLGIIDNTIKTVNVEFSFAGFDVQDNVHIGGELASRYILYWDVKDADGFNQYPLFAMGDGQHSIVINGQTVYPETDIACQTHNGKHAWIIYASALSDGATTDLYKVAPTTLTFAEGYTFNSGKTTYVLDGAFNVYISGADVVVGEDLVKSASLVSDTFTYSLSDGGYIGNLTINDGSDKEINLFNVKAYRNGTEETVLTFKKVEVNGEYKDLLVFEQFENLNAQYYVIKAGDRIGNVYELTKDVVIQLKDADFNVFNKDKVFNVVYTNLQGATNPNATTFSYATGALTLQDLPNPDGYVFGGWTINGTSVTAINLGDIGSDVEVTAKLSDGAKAVTILKKTSISVGQSISLNFFVKVSVYELSEITANFEFTYSSEEAPKTLNGATFQEYQKFNDNTAIYKLTYDGILPQHLCDEVKLKILSATNELLDDYSSSALAYCSALLAVTDPNVVNTDADGLKLLKTAISDIVEYGSAMQEMIGHDVDNTPADLIAGYDGKLATEFTSAIGANDYKKTGTDDKSYDWKTAKLVYDSVPTLVFNFVAPVGADLSVTLSYGETSYKNTSVILVEDAIPTQTVAVHQVRFFIPPTLFSQQFTLTINDGDVQKGQTLYYSVNAYIAIMLKSGAVAIEEKETLMAIYNYGVSTKKYSDHVAGRLFNVSFELNGGYVNGSSCDDQAIAHGRIPTIPSENPIREGYVFAGWDYDFASGVSDDIVITALWTAKKDTKYTVEYYLPTQGGYELKDTVTGFGTTESTATAIVKDYAGYQLDEATTTLTATILANGSTVIKVYYEEIVVPVIDGWRTYAGFSKTPITTSIAQNLDLGGFTATTAMNKFKLVYTLDKPVYAIITIGNHTEDFFLEAGKNVTFTSFTDDVLGTADDIANGISAVHVAQTANYTAGSPMEEKVTNSVSYTGAISIVFEPITKGETVNFLPMQFAITKQDVTDLVLYIQNERFKVGAHLYYGGALTYFEDLQDGRDDIGNLVNIHDGGRLIQQSYYGTDNASNYNIGYNPVQGGNGYGYSKIIDFDVTDDTIYIKARAKSWKETEAFRLSSSYMENWYSLENGYLRVDNTFVDFMDANNGDVSQETPAFYVVGALSTAVFYRGNNPWTDDTLSYKSEGMSLRNDAGWGGRFMDGGETWGAWINPEGWGIGVYTPGATGFGSWVTVEGELKDGQIQDTYNPYVNASSYLTLNRSFNITQFEKVSYSYIVTTGQIEEIRNTFKLNKDFAENEFPDTFGDTYDFTNIDFTDPMALSFTQRYNNAYAVYDEDRKATSIVVTGNGSDPNFGISLLGSTVRPLAEIYPYISIEYMIPAEYADVFDGKNMDLYIGVGDNEWVTGERHAAFKAIADGNYHVGYINFGQYEWYTGRINMLRFDFPNGLGVNFFIKSIKLCETAPEQGETYDDDYVPTTRTWLTAGSEAGNYYVAKGDNSGVQEDQSKYIVHGAFLVADGIHHFEYLIYETGTKASDYYKSVESEKEWRLAQRTSTNSYGSYAQAHPNIGDKGYSAAYNVEFPLNRYQDGKTYTIHVRVITHDGYACEVDTRTFTYVAPAQ